MKRYLVCPGHVTSRNDGERHYVGPGALMKLYGVNPRECVIQGSFGLEGAGKLKVLRPRFDGNYSKEQ